jgi:hypothetical protein
MDQRQLTQCILSDSVCLPLCRRCLPSTRCIFRQVQFEQPPKRHQLLPLRSWCQIDPHRPILPGVPAWLRYWVGGIDISSANADSPDHGKWREDLTGDQLPIRSLRTEFEVPRRHRLQRAHGLFVSNGPRNGFQLLVCDRYRYKTGRHQWLPQYPW